MPANVCKLSVLQGRYVIAMLQCMQAVLQAYNFSQSQVQKPNLRNILQALNIILAPALHMSHLKNVHQQSVTYKTIQTVSTPYHQTLN